VKYGSVCSGMNLENLILLCPDCHHWLLNHNHMNAAAGIAGSLADWGSDPVFVQSAKALIGIGPSSFDARHSEAGVREP